MFFTKEKKSKIAPGFSVLRKGTRRLKKKVAARTNLFRRKFSSKSELILTRPSSRDLDPEETEDIVAELPLLKNAVRRTRRSAWKEGDNANNINDFVISSAVLARTFSEDTKSTTSSGLYQPKDSPFEGKIEHPVVHKRDIFVSGDEDDDSLFKNLEETEVVNASTKTLPMYSISGSMLYKNIENGAIKDDSTKAARKIEKQTTNNLATNIAGSGLFHQSVANEDTYYTNHMLQSNQDNETKDMHPRPFLQNKPDESRKVAFALSSDSSEAGEVPCAIDRTDSKESAHSSVSSVTMYSTYQNDPLVRASNNLMDMLRSEKQSYSQQLYTQRKYNQQPYSNSIQSTNLYEA